jgi:predicted transposase YdaD
MIISQVPEAEEVAMTVAEELRAEGEAKGRAEGRAQGRVQGRAETLEKLMVLKFGALSVDQVAFIDTATEQQLDVYLERILTATSAAAVFADH